jgi:hypothetical protein
MTLTVPSWSADEAAKLPYPLIFATADLSTCPQRAGQERGRKLL